MFQTFTYNTVGFCSLLFIAVRYNVFIKKKFVQSSANEHLSGLVFSYQENKAALDMSKYISWWACADVSPAHS